MDELAQVRQQAHARHVGDRQQQPPQPLRGQTVGNLPVRGHEQVHVDLPLRRVRRDHPVAREVVQGLHLLVHVWAVRYVLAFVCVG